ncbi:MAG: hypothetical protein HFJ24_02390 [Clostridia bacterium]|nr:hypothetical protein [Clostridia bacterium]MCI9274890.1 hypothetical protein [Clostridia bacterium]
MRKTKEQGITLVALIITIIILIILTAVTINAAFNNGIIDTAVNGAVNYADAQNKEKISFEDLDKDIQDIVNKIENYGGSGEDSPSNHVPTIGDVTVTRVDNSTSELRVTATAEDEDEHDTLIYTLLRGTSEDDTNPTELSLEPENIEGRTVTFKDMGLEMAQTYYYKIQVSDGTDSVTSSTYSSERTWCKSSYCTDSRETPILCSKCGLNNNGQVTCTKCKGTSKSFCTKCGNGTYNKCTHRNWAWKAGDTRNGSTGKPCPVCGEKTGANFTVVWLCRDCNLETYEMPTIGCSLACGVDYIADTSAGEGVWKEADTICTTCKGYNSKHECPTCGHKGLMTCPTCNGEALGVEQFACEAHAVIRKSLVLYYK